MLAEPTQNMELRKGKQLSGRHVEEGTAAHKVRDTKVISLTNFRALKMFLDAEQTHSAKTVQERLQQ